MRGWARERVTSARMTEAMEEAERGRAAAEWRKDNDQEQRMI